MPRLVSRESLRALVLVEGLLQRDHQPALGGRRVAGADRVVDLDADLAQLAVEQAGRDAVAREARGLVDHDRVEAPGRRVAGLLGQRRPAGPVVLGAGLLVEELAHDLAAQLGRLAPAGLELRRARERLVLLVVGREAAVEGEAEAHQTTAAEWSERLVTIRAPDVLAPEASAGRGEVRRSLASLMPTGARGEQARGAPMGEVERRGCAVGAGT